jgi:flavin reductase (DIM6/NTAB) family NADH-FMN oxidoreductase RutF
MRYVRDPLNRPGLYFKGGSTPKVKDTADQKALAERFASGRADRWDGVAYTEAASGAPLLDGAAAHFECFNRSRYEEGDHVIFVGEVERCGHRAGASPLLFHGGKFYTEHPL